MYNDAWTLLTTKTSLEVCVLSVALDYLDRLSWVNETTVCNAKRSVNLASNWGQPVFRGLVDQQAPKLCNRAPEDRWRSLFISTNRQPVLNQGMGRQCHLLANSSQELIPEFNSVLLCDQDGTCRYGINFIWLVRKMTRCVNTQQQSCADQTSTVC